MTMTMTETPVPLAPTTLERAVAHLSLWTGTLLLTLPLRHTLRCAAGVRRVLGRRGATVRQAERHHATIRLAARRHPSRIACLETAIATTLIAALHGRRVTLVLGARFDPTELHAWIETNGTIIGETNEHDRELHRVYAP
ncbi:lasso peptide biosynthesis B2 protein [Embleya sp. NPDC050154]|uniref:lasso peptide biosynthesis B2 protein n=1 Tax=Embleya sp. NPDC050154 TaxID=3363988 RepID=UPI0037BAF739